MAPLHSLPYSLRNSQDDELVQETQLPPTNEIDIGTQFRVPFVPIGDTSNLSRSQTTEDSTSSSEGEGELRTCDTWTQPRQINTTNNDGARCQQARLHDHHHQGKHFPSLTQIQISCSLLSCFALCREQHGLESLDLCVQNSNKHGFLEFKLCV